MSQGRMDEEETCYMCLIVICERWEEGEGGEGGVMIMCVYFLLQAADDGSGVVRRGRRGRGRGRGGKMATENDTGEK